MNRYVRDSGMWVRVEVPSLPGFYNSGTLSDFAKEIKRSSAFFTTVFASIRGAEVTLRVEWGDDPAEVILKPEEVIWIHTLHPEIRFDNPFTAPAESDADRADFRETPLGDPAWAQEDEVRGFAWGTPAPTRLIDSIAKETDKALRSPHLTRQHHFLDDSGNPAGGTTYGRGFAISWQNGPTKGKEPNGAFVEGIINAAMGRLEFYQTTKFACSENASALEHLRLALADLAGRTLDRMARGVEGTHEQ